MTRTGNIPNTQQQQQQHVKSGRDGIPTIIFVASSDEENCENSAKWKGRDNWMDLASEKLLNKTNSIVLLAWAKTIRRNQTIIS